MRGMDIEEKRRLNLLRLIGDRFLGKRVTFANTVGLDQSYVGRMLYPADKKGRKAISTAMAKSIESKLGLPKNFLDEDPASKNEANLSQHSNFGDTVLIGESTIQFAAGIGYEPIIEPDTQGTQASYRLEWFRSERIDPSKCRRFKVRGDSMERTLFDGDTILVNMAETTVIDGKVYAVRMGNELRVKRLRLRVDGSMLIESDNSATYPTEILTADKIPETLVIIGRVRDKSGKGGL
jgi:phage repressor protein C with HTH and peptisase S24 domain